MKNSSKLNKKEDLIKRKRNLNIREVLIVLCGVALVFVLPLILFIPALIGLYLLERPIRRELKEIKQKLGDKK